ncbi:hypothetical protein LIA77_10354 [Sarocladium implicatum]|nr:hypothetical protein LIA77_10354 [Sarocladium implicatum]
MEKILDADKACVACVPACHPMTSQLCAVQTHPWHQNRSATPRLDRPARRFGQAVTPSIRVWGPETGKTQIPKFVKPVSRLRTRRSGETDWSLFRSMQCQPSASLIHPIRSQRLARLPLLVQHRGAQPSEKSLITNRLLASHRQIVRVLDFIQLLLRVRPWCHDLLKLIRNVSHLSHGTDVL